MLKPKHITTTKQPAAQNNIHKLLKPMRIAATTAHKPAASRRTTPQDQPQRQGGTSHTRTHSFASPATHERIEVEVEIDFPVQGVGQAGLAPLNLRLFFLRGGTPPPQTPFKSA